MNAQTTVEQGVLIAELEELYAELNQATSPHRREELLKMRAELLSQLSPPSEPESGRFSVVITRFLTANIQAAIVSLVAGQGGSITFSQTVREVVISGNPPDGLTTSVATLVVGTGVGMETRP